MTEDGKLIYYPFREPNPEEIVFRTRPAGFGPRKFRAIENFGDLTVFMVRSESGLYIVGDEAIFPFRMDTLIRDKVYCSEPKVSLDDEDQAAYNIYIYFAYWYPTGDPNKKGRLFVPSELPLLQSVGFRLTRLD